MKSLELNFFPLFCYIFLISNSLISQSSAYFLEDFSVEKIELKNSENYKVSKNNLSFHTFSKPIKILDSFSNSIYCAIVYQDIFKRNYLVRLKKAGQDWALEQNNLSLDLITGISSKIVKDANWINTNTLVLTFYSKSVVLKENREIKSVWNFIGNKIEKYDFSGLIFNGNKPNLITKFSKK